MRLTAPTRALRREVFACMVPSIFGITLTSPAGLLISSKKPKCSTGRSGSNGATFWCTEQANRCSPKQRFQKTGKCENLPN
jgi:hypothetical protein